MFAEFQSTLDEEKSNMPDSSYLKLCNITAQMYSAKKREKLHVVKYRSQRIVSFPYYSDDELHAESKIVNTHNTVICKSTDETGTAWCLLNHSKMRLSWRDHDLPWIIQNQDDGTLLIILSITEFKGSLPGESEE